MKRFMRKQLPALLLVLVMLVGMMPAAAAASADFSYTVKAGKELELDRKEFREFFEEEYDDFYSLEFTDVGNLDKYGHFEATDAEGETVELNKSDLKAAYFYYASADVEYEDEYELSGLTFVADKKAKSTTLTLEANLLNEDDDEMPCTIEIKVTTSSSSSSSDADLEYTVKPGKELSIDRKDFKKLFEDEYDNFSYIVFESAKNLEDGGILYAKNYDGDKTNLNKKDPSDVYLYYSSSDMEDEDYDYDLGTLTFKADKNGDGETVTLTFTMYGEKVSQNLEGTMVIEVEDDSDDEDDDVDSDIVCEVDPGKTLTFNRKDFKTFFEDEYEDDDFSYVTFTKIKNLDKAGSITAVDYYEDEVELNEEYMDGACFYYYASDVVDRDYDYELDGMFFTAKKSADGMVVTMEYTMYGEDEELDGVMTIEIGDVDSSSDDEDEDDEDADITYSVEPEDEVSFDRKDFKELFEEEYEDLSYVVFTDVDNLDDTGKLYALNYEEEETRIKESALEDAYFYYSSADVEDEDYDYELDGILFKAAKGTDGEVVTLEFTMYGKSAKNKVSGVLAIEIGDVGSTSISGSGSGDIRYTTTYASSVQLNANHFASFLKATYPNSSLQYVKITGVPSAGSVYYDYYNTSDYGEKVRLTSDNCDDYKFYFSPDDEDQYALTELSFIPNGFNYCPAISFTAYGSGSKSVSGEILISVTLNKIPDVYGVTPKGTTVTFPASAINSAVNTGTGAGVGSIRLLSLPASSQGSVRLSNGLKADTSTKYVYSTSGNATISALQFVPASGFTGNVEIPYVAYNASGNAVGSGLFSLGVVNAVPKFKDVTSATWCYKYVAEMCDAGVISGYSDGTYRPNSALTYGAALKLIMLAAGYEKQAEPAGNRFANYLTLAKKEGIVSGNPNLGGSITRLQVAQIAAKAMDLDTSDLSSVKPFTDTSDKYVQALNAAGIVEGYFSNGTSTFKGSNTLTRGHISAIVWRMENYKG